MGIFQDYRRIILRLSWFTPRDVYVYVYVHVHVHVYLCIYVYVCIYVYMYTVNSL